MKFNILSRTLMIFVLYLLVINCAKEYNPRINTNTKSASKLIPSKAIYGGQVVNDAPPWIAILLKKESSNSATCTGEFITSYDILTAAHCANNINFVGYKENKDDIAYKRVRVVDRFFYDEINDIVLLRLANAYPDIRVKPAELYHGFYFNNYSEFNNVDNLIAMGYGIFSSTEPNPDAILKLLHMYVRGADSNNDLLWIMTKSETGYTYFGDSGGPLLYESTFNGHIYNKLIGVISDGASHHKTNYFTGLSVNILKWIAIKTGRVIITSPLDNSYILLQDNTVEIRGYGILPKDSKVSIYNSHNEQVATCDDSLITYGDSYWKCDAKFINNYNNSIGSPLEYQAIVQNLQSKTLDFVNFKIAKVDVSLTITHPDPEFIYHTPIGKTYLITGYGTPKENITFKLNDIDTNYESDSPCINKDFGLIDQYGIWRCRIMVNNDIKQVKYKLEVAYTKGDNLNSNSQVAPYTISNVVYSVNPIPSPYLHINQPLESSLIFSEGYNISFSYGVESVASIVRIYSGKPRVSWKFFPLESGYHDFFLGHADNKSTDIELNNTLTFQIYIDKDEQPIIESSVNYSMAMPFIQIESISHLTELGSEVTILGKVYYYNTKYEVKPLSGDVVIEITNPERNKWEFCRTAVHITDGTWECANKLVLDSAGIYKVKAILYDSAGTDYLTESIINVNTIEPLRIKNPCCCNSCVIN